MRWRADHRYGYGIKGFGRFSDYGLRFSAMVSEKAQYQCKVLRFGRDTDWLRTLEAFKLKRRTLYHWRRQLRMDGGDLEALNESPEPHV